MKVKRWQGGKEMTAPPGWGAPGNAFSGNNPASHAQGTKRMRDHTVSTNLETALLSTEC